MKLKSEMTKAFKEWLHIAFYDYAVITFIILSLGVMLTGAAVGGHMLSIAAAAGPDLIHEPEPFPTRNRQ